MVAENRQFWRGIGKCRHDAADVLDEAEVEHAIGLIQHEALDAAEVEFTGLHQVADAAWRADHDVGATAHRFDLLVAAGTADDDRRPQAQVDGEIADRLIDLQGQFAGRRQDQGTRRERGRADVMRREMLQQRKREGGGLAAAGLGDAQQIASRQQWLDGVGLDRRGDFKLAGFERAQQRFGHTEGRESRLGQDELYAPAPSLWTSA